MKRRDFLKGGLAAAIAAVVPTVAAKPFAADLSALADDRDEYIEIRLSASQGHSTINIYGVDEFGQPFEAAYDVAPGHHRLPIGKGTVGLVEVTASGNSPEATIEIGHAI